MKFDKEEFKETLDFYLKPSEIKKTFGGSDNLAELLISLIMIILLWIFLPITIIMAFLIACKI